jgi:phospholipase C
MTSATLPVAPDVHGEVTHRPAAGVSVRLVGDLRDRDYAERLEAEAPEAYYRRREFLQRTAMTAGLAAGLGTVLDAETLVAEAARKQRRRPLPSPRNLPIDTFVVLMMENRSFDHYLGWLPGADGRQAGLTYVDGAGQSHQTARLAPDFQGCAHPDPDHSWEGGRQQVNGGKMDGFLRSGDNDVFSVGYYAEQDLPFIGHAAKAFTTYDRFFCSLLASTYPNREYMHAAQSYGKVDNSFPEVGFQDQGFPDTTIFAALKARNVDSRYFFNDLPVSALWGAKGLQRSGRIEEYYQRCSQGSLPPLSFVDPSFANESGGTSGDEHPHGDIRAGQAFMSDVVHAFMESPQWKRGALFIVYDEWGGFFDHVRPPRVPDIRNDPDPNKDFGQMGIRIPAVTVSPWVRRGHVNHSIFGFESILKMIEYRFGIPPLTRRDAYAQNIARSFDWESKPRLGLPNLPEPKIQADGGPAPERPKEHDLMALLTSGYLDRLGFKYRPATPASTYRQPHKVHTRLQSTQ